MADRPILFSAPMVRALLAGTKTQTRRVVTPQPQPDSRGVMMWQISKHRAIGFQGKDVHPDIPEHCPYGQPGDRLWVRETWAPEQYDQLATSVAEVEATLNKPAYRADWDHRPTQLPARTWRPSIHMPRAASRITLEVTGVRVERLQDISEADAMSEGAPPSHPSIDRISREYGYPDFPRSWYAQLWDHINGPGSWEANPWVWVVSFKRVTP